MKNIETTVNIVRINDDITRPTDYDCYDRQEIKAWEDGEWSFIGVRVEVQRHDWNSGVTATYTSSGLWGIESTADESYLVQTAQDELETLKNDYPELATVTLDKFTVCDRHK